jgi:hypothetical protein
MDTFGRAWPYPKEELCQECGQPDNVGDCNHARLTDEEVLLILNGPDEDMEEAMRYDPSTMRDEDGPWGGGFARNH